ncbi:MAG: hypothetical protein D3923_10760, partial [Candidatus Electrothrix sp. AR3]|nr:hypothetical protein [Candidatus Electrothrix sp. AR3]
MYHSMLQPRKYTLLFLLFFFFSWTSYLSAAMKDDMVVEKTMTVFSQIPGLTSQQLQTSRKAFQKMHYNSQRAVRKMSLLPGANFILSKKSWALLEQKQISFEQLLAFEAWTDLPGATMPMALQTLSVIRKLRREAVKTFKAALGLQGLHADLALQMISRINALKDANKLAAHGLFSVQGMGFKQAWAS